MIGQSSTSSYMNAQFVRAREASCLLRSLDEDDQQVLWRILCAALDEGRPLRLGIMGGTFDPIHYGHLVTGDEALTQFHLDVVIYLVAAEPALKQHLSVSDASLRVEMTRLALADNDKMLVSSFELMRPGISYTVDTLAALAREGRMLLSLLGLEERCSSPAPHEDGQSDAVTIDTASRFWDNDRAAGAFDITFITGLDAICSIAAWERPHEIGSYARMVAATRPGHSVEAAYRALAQAHCSFEVAVMPIPSLEISSTYLRKCLQHGESVRYLTPDSVVNFARQNRVYETDNRRYIQE